jgi:hypothetical protein
LPTTAIKGYARPVTSNRPASRPARRLHVGSCPQRRPPPHRESRPRPRQASQRRDIFLPAIVEPRSFPSSKIPGHTALPAPINGGRQSLVAPHLAIEPRQPSLAPPPHPIAPPPLASAAARTAPRSRLPKQLQPKVSTGMRSPRSALRFAPSPGRRRGQGRRRAPLPAGLPRAACPPASVCSQERRRRRPFSQKPPDTLLFLPHRAPLLFPFFSFPRYPLNLKFLHQNTPVIFR